MSGLSQKWAWEQEVGGLTKLLLLALAENTDDTGYCWPGQAHLAAKTGMSVRAVHDHLHLLIESRLVATKRRADSRGRRKANGYQLAMDYMHETHVREQPYRQQVPVVNRPYRQTAHSLSANDVPSYRQTAQGSVGNPPVEPTKEREELSISSSSEGMSPVERLNARARELMEERA